MWTDINESNAFERFFETTMNSFLIKIEKKIQI